MANNQEDRFAAIREAARKFKAAFGPAEHPAITIFEDACCYPMEDVVELYMLRREVEMERSSDEARAEKIQAFVAKRDTMQRLENAPERHYLWPEDKAVPTVTEYADNSDFTYNHDPDFRPYFYELLVPEDVTPKGLVVFCAGGDHGCCVIHEAYQSAKDFNAMGYQAIVLLNRPNSMPWSGIDAGADSARCIRMVRKNAGYYRIRPDQIAFAGFSNGGLTGENCIRYFSGEKKMTDYYPSYQPDAYDEVYGAPDAFLCVYGPRFVGAEFDWEGVVYPPTFYAIGRLDTAVDNMNYAYPTLLEHGVPVEVHTFAGVPHGQAGVELIDGEIRYPNFQMWVPLADYFLQDLFKK